MAQTNITDKNAFIATGKNLYQGKPRQMAPYGIVIKILRLKFTNVGIAATAIKPQSVYFRTKKMLAEFIIPVHRMPIEFNLSLLTTVKTLKINVVGPIIAIDINNMVDIKYKKL